MSQTRACVCVFFSGRTELILATLGGGDKRNTSRVPTTSETRPAQRERRGLSSASRPEVLDVTTSRSHGVPANPRSFKVDRAQRFRLLKPR